MKIAIYYDSLIDKGGAQRVVIELANRLNADIITCGYNKNINQWLPIKGKVIDIGNSTYKYNVALSFFFEVPLRFLFYKNTDYDINIFFGVSSIFAAKRNQTNIWFCFSPNRLLYDLKKWKLKNSPLIKNIFFSTHILTFYMLDQKIVKDNITTIIAQTEHVKKRIKKYYGKNSQVIYSPLDISVYKFDKLGDYFLAVSRLMPEKRMDMIAKTFTQIKQSKLIMVGDGPEKQNILQIIKKSKNIQLLTNVNEKTLIDLYAKCYTTIYLPIAEDFGLVPLESMASGKICIAANEGGCKETIINNKTGILINASVDNLKRVIRNLNRNKIAKMKDACIKQAKLFDISNNLNMWNKLLKTYDQSR